MRERQLIAGPDHFDKTRDNGQGIAYLTLPANIRKVHAFQDFRWHPTEIYTEPQFCDAPWKYEMALCGAKVKVVLPKVLDPGDPDVCPRCAVAGFAAS